MDGDAWRCELKDSAEMMLQGAGASAEGRYAAIRKYIYYSTILGVFSGSCYIYVGFHLLPFYGIMLGNFLLMFLLVNYGRIPAWIPCFLLYLGLSGVAGILHGTDSIPLFGKEFLGISISLLYFYYFFRLIRNDFERAFRTYARIALWFALLGTPLWIVYCVHAGTFLRLKGLTTEPASLCIIILPAYYWYARQYITSRKHGMEVIAFTLVVIFSGSSLGYISVAFGVVLLLSGRLKHLLIVPLAVGGLLYLAYSVSTNFKVRVNDTLFAANTDDLTDANYSTYALLSNAYVTQQVLHESPILGNGLGSHSISHERFLGSIPGIEQFITAGGADLNADDAASLILRSLSELGVVGLLGELFFLAYFYVGGTGKHAVISNAILVCFFLKLLRNGLYFPPEQFFFILIYMLNHRQFKLEARAGLSMGKRAVPATG